MVVSGNQHQVLGRKLQVHFQGYPVQLQAGQYQPRLLWRKRSINEQKLQRERSCFTILWVLEGAGWNCVMEQESNVGMENRERFHHSWRVVGKSCSRHVENVKIKTILRTALIQCYQHHIIINISILDTQLNWGLSYQRKLWKRLWVEEMAFGSLEVWKSMRV